jgi:hypothetical protein
MRPLADQIADAILSEKPELYEAFLSIKAQASLRDPYSHTISGEHGLTLLGVFLSRWVLFERFIRRLARLRDIPMQAVPTTKTIELALGEQPVPLKTIARLRVIRNNLVHGHRQPSPDLLQSSIDEFDTVLETLGRSDDSQIREALVWASSDEEDHPPPFFPRRNIGLK